jgi:hypothetical protein
MQQLILTMGVWSQGQQFMVTWLWSAGLEVAGHMERWISGQQEAVVTWL